MVITIAMTMATMGRRTKNADIAQLAGFAGAGFAAGSAAGAGLAAGSTPGASLGGASFAITVAPVRIF